VNKRAPDTIVKFGGHAMAAGLTIVREHYELFKQTLEQAVLAMSEPEHSSNKSTPMANSPPPT